MSRNGWKNFKVLWVKEAAFSGLQTHNRSVHNENVGRLIVNYVLYVAFRDSFTFDQVDLFRNPTSKLMYKLNFDKIILTDRVPDTSTATLSAPLSQSFSFLSK